MFLKSSLKISRFHFSTKSVPLEAFHKNVLKAKMTSFGGYNMPVQYSGSLKEQKACRSSAALFDVSHMGPAYIRGKDAFKLIESATVADMSSLKPLTGAYSVIPNDNGGLIDDTVVSHFGEKAYIVFNASRKDVDKARFEELAKKNNFSDVEVHLLDQDYCLLALQGPKAEEVLVQVLPKIKASIEALHFMQSYDGLASELGSSNDLIITRCGYTGEDGFEILLPNEVAEKFATRLLQVKNQQNQQIVSPAGLGARDILRTEAGLCLYGNDINEQTTPIEAGLLFTISKRRRVEGGFPGADKIQGQIMDKTLIKKKRVGFKMEDKSAIREGQKLYLPKEDFSLGEEAGVVTSGMFSPSVGVGIGMGYVSSNSSKSGTKLVTEVRGKKVKTIELSKMPFVPSRVKK